MSDMSVNHFQSKKPSIRLSAGQWVSQLSILPLVRASVCPSVSQRITTVSQLVGWSVGQSVSQLVGQLCSQSANESVSPSVSRQSFILNSSKRKLTKYNKLDMRHSSTKHIFRLTRDHSLILKADFHYLKQFICMLKSALVAMVSTLQGPRDFRSGISGCRDFDWQLGAFSDGHGWRNLGRETRGGCTCWKMMILRTQTPLIRKP